MSVGGLGRRDKGSTRLSEASDSENEHRKSLSEASDDENERSAGLSEAPDGVNENRNSLLTL